MDSIEYHMLQIILDWFCSIKFNSCFFTEVYYSGLMIVTGDNFHFNH